MPPLIVLAAVGAGVYFGLKYLANEGRKAAARPSGKAGKKSASPDDVKAQTLKKDPKTGVYRVDE